MSNIIINKKDVFSVDYDLIKKNILNNVELTKYEDDTKLESVGSIEINFKNVNELEVSERTTETSFDEYFEEEFVNLIDTTQNTIDGKKYLSVSKYSAQEGLLEDPIIQNNLAYTYNGKFILFCATVEFEESFLTNIKKQGTGSGVDNLIYTGFLKCNIETSLFVDQHIFIPSNKTEKDILGEVYYYGKKYNQYDIPYRLKHNAIDDYSTVRFMYPGQYYVDFRNMSAYSMFNYFKMAVLEDSDSLYYRPNSPTIIICERIKEFYEQDYILSSGGTKHTLKDNERFVIFYLAEHFKSTQYLLDEYDGTIVDKDFFIQVPKKYNIDFQSYKPLGKNTHYFYNRENDLITTSFEDAPEFRNHLIIDDNELLTQYNLYVDSSGNATPLPDKLAFDLLTDYKNGLRTMNISVGNFIYYNEEGELVYNGNEGNFFKVGDKVKIPFINNITYLITSSEFVFDNGQYRINLSLKEFINK